MAHLRIENFRSSLQSTNQFSIGGIGPEGHLNNVFLDNRIMNSPEMKGKLGKEIGSPVITQVQLNSRHRGDGILIIKIDYRLA